VGWRPHSEQIGQTGKSIAPALYVACGISGSPQHFAGISGAGTIVALNSDPHAPIFSLAHYGLVGDVHQLLPKLIFLLQECLQKK
jgi:electron transfer flavoprotein alpha subunit